MKAFYNVQNNYLKYNANIFSYSVVTWRWRNSFLGSSNIKVMKFIF